MGLTSRPEAIRTKMYNVKAVAPLISGATQNRKQEPDDATESFTINAARTNVAQLSSEKRELLSPRIR